MPSDQELVFSRDHDYRQSPHAKHLHLYEKLLSELRSAMRNTADRGLQEALLEVGAGQGIFVEPALAYGYDVTASEMSRPAVERMQDRYGQNASFEAVFDPDGDLTPLAGRRYSVIFYASVLHHIPDYLKAIDQAVSRHLAPGGALVTFQDPLWYPGLDRGVRALSEASYLAWRLSHGNYVRGVRTRVRRLRGGYDEGEPSDTVEYHVVRQGVNQERIVESLAERFEDVTLGPYWSTPWTLGQWLGERLGIHNTFCLVALGHRG